MLEAIRLGRLLVELMPDEPEALGLAQPHAAAGLTPQPPASRPPASSSLSRTKSELSRTRRRSRRGAACSIAPCGATARARTSCRRRSLPATRTPGPPPRPTGARSLSSITGSSEIVPIPVVLLNRAVAVAMAHGPASGLALVDRARPNRDAGRLLPTAGDPRRSPQTPQPPRRGRDRVSPARSSSRRPTPSGGSSAGDCPRPQRTQYTADVSI